MVKSVNTNECSKMYLKWLHTYFTPKAPRRKVDSGEDIFLIVKKSCTSIQQTKITEIIVGFLHDDNKILFCNIGDDNMFRDGKDEMLYTDHQKGAVVFSTYRPIRRHYWARQLLKEGKSRSHHINNKCQWFSINAHD